MQSTRKPNLVFWLIAIFALAWNLLGVGAYLFEATASPETLLASYSEYEANAVISRPAWATGIFALAVFGGALGSLGLVLKKKWAMWPLCVSLGAVILQQIYIWTQTDAAAHISGAGWLMPVMIPLIAVYLVFFTRRAIARGLLK